MNIRKFVMGSAIASAISLSATVAANAGVMTYTSSTAFAAAAGALSTENYGTGSAGQSIAQGGTFDGLTYSFTAGPIGTLQNGIITDQFNSFTGLSLGGLQSSGAQYFFGGDSVTVTFASPVDSVGAFFNVNANSGDYLTETADGTASTGSASFDTSTFVFAGLISTTPFTSVTFMSDSVDSGSFNIPEIEFGITNQVPEPLTLSLFAAGLVGAGAMRRKRKKAD
jgi:hypothetical protein